MNSESKDVCEPSLEQNQRNKADTLADPKKGKDRELASQKLTNKHFPKTRRRSIILTVQPMVIGNEVNPH